MIDGLEQPITSREELNVLLARSRDFIAQMTPAERDSLWAAQSLTWLVSEKLSNIQNDGDDPSVVLSTLYKLRARVERRVSVDRQAAEEMVPVDRLYVIQHIDDAIQKVQALIAQAA